MDFVMNCEFFIILHIHHKCHVRHSIINDWDGSDDRDFAGNCIDWKFWNIDILSVFGIYFKAYSCQNNSVDVPHV